MTIVCLFYKMNYISVDEYTFAALKFHFIVQRLNVNGAFQNIDELHVFVPMHYTKTRIEWITVSVDNFKNEIWEVCISI